MAVVITTSVCTACAQSQSQPNTIKERVDNYFAENPGKFSGAIEIQENGKTVYQKAFGFADKENNIPATRETKFVIGSISKTFTSVMVLKAAKDGKLSLSDPLSKFFPDAQIPNAEKITVDMLLYHRSGLSDVVNDHLVDHLT
ncbi:MAG: beta-lactamase family protein, partial [Bacteroidales bacterium]|nr:beta-lactamase family protein [Bacteroidales bacterium]